MHQDRLPACPRQGRPICRGHPKGREDKLRVSDGIISYFKILFDGEDSTIIPLQIWDTPSNFELDQLDVPLASFSTIIYVMDMQVSPVIVV